MEYVLVVRWLVVLGLLAAAGVPIAVRLFPRLPGRGVGFALPVSLVVLTTGAYWVGHVTFGPVALVSGMGLLLVASGLAGLDLSALRDRRVALASDLDIDRRALAEVAVVFTVAFLFMVAIRAVDPAVHPLGGEKFLDFGLLQSLRRATALPPEDMWFAGEPVAYYYGGHLIASLLSRLTATPPSYAYNLALAGFYALVVTAAYDLAAAIAGSRGGSRVYAGVIAAFVVGVSSNLVTVGRLSLLALPEAMRRQAAEGVAAESGYTVEEILSGAQSFFYFHASRVIPGTINEFPFFAWLNGDLHAHMMGTPFLLLAAALAFSYYRTPAEERGRRRVLVYGAIPVVAGLLAIVDTWSFPTVFGLLWLTVTFAPATPLSLLPSSVVPSSTTVSTDGGSMWTRFSNELARPLAALLIVVPAALVAVSFAFPFLTGAAQGGGRSIAILAPSERSALGPLFLVHGAFVLSFGAYLLSRLRVERPLVLLVGLAAVGVVALGNGLAVGLLVVPLLVFGWVALRAGRPVGFETVLVVAGAGLVTLVELVYVVELAGPLRMNTVFKTYMQVWVLWATAVGVVLPALVADPPRWLPWVRLSLPTRRTVSTVFVAALLASTTIYAGLALDAHFTNAPDPTLNATAFVERDHPGEAPAIRWLDDRPGQPTLLSAPGTSWYPGDGSDPRSRVMYSWGANPAASLTGVPTVAGWHHEVGYRGTDAYGERVADADTMFTGTTAERVALLREYDVRYIWVGPSERARYDAVSFDDVSGIEVAYESSTVTIYRVDQSALPSA
ncbi:MAG: DUF2298 domain-containing protein [Halobacteriota archaeon]